MKLTRELKQKVDTGFEKSSGDEFVKAANKHGIELSKKNVIPEITDPLGRAWRQPDKKKILIDDHHAVMNKKEFDELSEYSATLPTGVYEGKMWRLLSDDNKNYLYWYGASDNPKKCSVNSREIILI